MQENPFLPHKKAFQDYLMTHPEARKKLALLTSADLSQLRRVFDDLYLDGKISSDIFYRIWNAKKQNKLNLTLFYIAEELSQILLNPERNKIDILIKASCNNQNHYYDQALLFLMDKFHYNVDKAEACLAKEMMEAAIFLCASICNHGFILLNKIKPDKTENKRQNADEILKGITDFSQRYCRTSYQKNFLLEIAHYLCLAKKFDKSHAKQYEDLINDLLDFVMHYKGDETNYLKKVKLLISQTKKSLKKLPESFYKDKCLELISIPIKTIANSNSQTVYQKILEEEDKHFQEIKEILITENDFAEQIRQSNVRIKNYKQKLLELGMQFDASITAPNHGQILKPSLPLMRSLNNQLASGLNKFLAGKKTIESKNFESDSQLSTLSMSHYLINIFNNEIKLSPPPKKPSLWQRISRLWNPVAEEAVLNFKADFNNYQDKKKQYAELENLTKQIKSDAFYRWALSNTDCLISDNPTTLSQCVTEGSTCIREIINNENTMVKKIYFREKHCPRPHQVTNTGHENATSFRSEAEAGKTHTAAAPSNEVPIQACTR